MFLRVGCGGALKWLDDVVRGGRKFEIIFIILLSLFQKNNNTCSVIRFINTALYLKTIDFIVGNWNTLSSPLSLELTPGKNHFIKLIKNYHWRHFIFFHRIIFYSLVFCYETACVPTQRRNHFSDLLNYMNNHSKQNKIH